MCAGVCAMTYMWRTEKLEFIFYFYCIIQGSESGCQFIEQTCLFTEPFFLS